MTRNDKPLKAVVLAAGKGTRISADGSDLPKVMRLANSRPLLSYVLEALNFIRPEDIHIVAGYKREQVLAAYPGYSYAIQEEQLGTGHAVIPALTSIPGYTGDILICYGDMPLIRRETYTELVRHHRESGAQCTILSGVSDEYLPYGRILRDADGGFACIVEERDCTEEQKKIRELNSGVYAFAADPLRSVLGSLSSDNAQGELYLTDAPLLMRERGMAISICKLDLGLDILGVNTAEQLFEVENILKARSVS